MTVLLPNASQAFLDRFKKDDPDPAYRRWMENVTEALNAAGSAEDLQALIDHLSTDGTIEGIPEPSELELIQGVGIAITNGNTIALRTLSDSGTGTFKLIDRDSYGRISGSADGDSDDVPEGATNLYFTAERVDDRVAALLVAGDNVTLDYDDTANTLTVSATGGGSSEILVTGAAGPVALTTEDETDWLYT